MSEHQEYRTSDSPTIESTLPEQWCRGRDYRHAVRISDCSDFDRAVTAAETLDLTLTECVLSGYWKSHPEADCGFGRGVSVEVEKAGKKWFHLRFDHGEVVRGRPAESDHSEDGYLTLYFDTEGGSR